MRRAILPACEFLAFLVFCAGTCGAVAVVQFGF
jgi:hypothetical protein